MTESVNSINKNWSTLHGEPGPCGVGRSTNRTARRTAAWRQQQVTCGARSILYQNVRDFVKFAMVLAVMEDGKVVEKKYFLEIFKNPQQPITKRFVQQVTEPGKTKETIEHLLGAYSSGEVVQLSFVGKGAEQPLITNLIAKTLVLPSNILQGKISQTKTDPMEHYLYTI